MCVGVGVFVHTKEKAERESDSILKSSTTPALLSSQALTSGPIEGSPRAATQIV